MSHLYQSALLFAILIFSFSLNAQSPEQLANISKDLRQFDVDVIDLEVLNNSLAENDFNKVILVLGYQNYTLELVSSNLKAEAYFTQDQNGPVNIAPPKTFKGHLSGDLSTDVRLTINDGFLMGSIETGDRKISFQPASYFDHTISSDYIVSYLAEAVINHQGKICDGGLHAELSQKIEQDISKTIVPENQPEAGLCFEVDYALAADFLMSQNHGGLTGTLNHVFGVLNDVQGNYDDEFADELSFIVTTTFIVTISGADPWTSSTDAPTLLTSFNMWALSGFGAIHDVATLWTGRDFDGITVGYAYFGVVCTSARYNVLQDYSSTAWELRFVQAHELGHNFNAVHDFPGSPTIMTPYTDNVNDWSAISITAIENHYLSRACLGLCPVSTPPTALYDVNIVIACATGVVQYNDLSTGGATAWAWTFPGGSPSTSTLQNPIVSYPSAGTYNATLVATNSVGSDTYSLTVPFEILEEPQALFSYQLVWPTTVVFTNASINGTSYFWNFGDGNTSVLEHPVHSYTDDGIFTVILSTTNVCGVITSTQTITIDAAPTADFIANNTQGCALLTVDYHFTGANSPSDFNWTFPGGHPASSTNQNPFVVYTMQGTHEVILEVSNSYGIDTLTKTDFIFVEEAPSASITFTNDSLNFDFMSTVSNAITLGWDFGDGNISSLANPNHNYTMAGDYLVTLTTMNGCGETIITQNVTATNQMTVPTFYDNCEEAYLNPILDLTQLEGQLWSMSPDSNGTGPNPLCPTPCAWSGITGIAQNTFWLSFYAPNACVAFDVLPSNCNGPGVQYGIISAQGDPCNGGFCVSCSADCNSSLISINSCDYYPGCQYFLFFDGCQGADCDLTIEVSGTGGTFVYPPVNTDTCIGCDEPNPPPMGSAYQICQGTGDLTFSFNSDAAGYTNYYNYCVGNYQWRITPSLSSGPIPNTSSNELTLDFSDYAPNQTVQLCLDAIGNPTYNHPPHCVDIEIGDAEPVSSFTEIQNGVGVIFQNTSLHGDSYLWDFGDGNTSVEINPSHSYTSVGSYQVKLTVTNDCGMAMITKEVLISLAPFSAFEAPGSTSGCAPYQIQFYDLSTNNPTSWAWSFPGGSPSSSTMQNPSVLYEIKGSFDVSLVATNSTGTDMLGMQDYITIDSIPLAIFSFSVNGFDVDFSSQATNVISESWDFGDGNSSLSSNPTHSYAGIGNYTVVHIVENACGSDTASLEVSISALPMAAFEITNTGPYCVGDTVYYQDLSSNQPSSWEWTFAGGTPASSTDQNVAVVYTALGFYDVSLAATNGIGSDTLEISNHIEILSLPIPSFDFSTAALEVQFSSTSVNANTLVWDFGDGNTSMDQNPSHTYGSEGMYTVVLKAINVCGESTMEIIVNVMSSSVEDLEQHSFVIAPNPNDGSFTIVFEERLSANIDLSITDILGNRVVYKREIAAGKKSISLNENFAKGTYLLSLKVGSDRIVKKLVILN